MLAFMLISLGVGFVTATIPPIADSEIPPFGQPLHGVVGGALGVALAAFLVTAGLSGRAGVADLGRRSVRWRVPVRWYLIALFSVPVAATLISLAIYGPRALAAPSGGWPRALAEVAAFFLLQLVIFHLPRRLDSPGSSSITGRTATAQGSSPCTSRCCGRYGICPTTSPRKAGDLNRSSRHLSFSPSSSSRCSSPAPCSCGPTTAPVAACCWSFRQIDWLSHVAPVRAPNQEAGVGICTRDMPPNGRKTGSASSDGTSSAAPSATRRRRNHAKNTIGKPCAGKLPARIERGMENRPAQWSCAPDYQWMLMYAPRC